jgi:hypothetical protein
MNASQHLTLSLKATHEGLLTYYQDDEPRKLGYPVQALSALIRLIQASEMHCDWV